MIYQIITKCNPGKKDTHFSARFCGHTKPWHSIGDRRQQKMHRSRGLDQVSHSRYLRPRTVTQGDAIPPIWQSLSSVPETLSIRRRRSITRRDDRAAAVRCMPRIQDASPKERPAKLATRACPAPDLPQPCAARRNETARQSILAELVDRILPALGAAVITTAGSTGLRAALCCLPFLPRELLKEHHWQVPPRYKHITIRSSRRPVRLRVAARGEYQCQEIAFGTTYGLQP